MCALLGSALLGSGAWLGYDTHSVNNDRMTEMCSLLVMERLGFWEGTLSSFYFSLPFTPASSVPGRKGSVTEVAATGRYGSLGSVPADVDCPITPQCW